MMNIHKNYFLVLGLVLFFHKSLHAYETWVDESLQRQISVSDSALGDEGLMAIDEDKMSSGGEEIQEHFRFDSTASLDSPRPVAPSLVDTEIDLPSPGYSDFIKNLQEKMLKMSVLARRHLSTPIPSKEQPAADFQEATELSDDSSSESDTEDVKRKKKKKLMHRKKVRK